MELSPEVIEDIHNCINVALEDIRDYGGGGYEKMGFYNLYEFIYKLIEQVFTNCPEVVVFKRVQDWYFEQTGRDYLVDKTLQVDYLSTIPLPAQRTDEWFKFRLDRITASDFASVLNLGHYAKPFEVLERKVTGNMTYSPNKFTIHGTKYEDVACRAYELRTDSHITEFGCLPHPKYDMLGASPDGISDEGIMLEIKCPYSRVIKGFPPIYYWTQMQLQLEVADLEVCDFLEVCIEEYATEYEFLEDSVEDSNMSKTYNLEKGIVIELILDNGKTEYLYPAFNVSAGEQIVTANNMIENILKSGRTDITSINHSYFYFKKYSCIRIFRDRTWFETVLPNVYEFWSEVLTWRNQGIENHPKYIEREKRRQSRPKKEKVTGNDRDLKMLEELTGGKCIFDL